MIRLHILAVPNTVTRDEFSHCAFTGKVKRFAPMMRSVGFEVFHYGVETSESGADKEVELLSMREWNDLRLQTLRFLHPTRTEAECVAWLADPTKFAGELCKYDTPLFDEFNRRLRAKLAEHYRDPRTDIICTPLTSKAYEKALKDTCYVVVETGIGYNHSCENYRIFESYAWMHHAMALEKKTPQNYWFVIPHSFSVSEFPLSLTPKKNTVGFLGRIGHDKGCNIIVEAAKRFPHVTFILCGQGDPMPYLTVPNLIYKLPIHGAERAEYLGSLCATFAVTNYLEPFGAAVVESQLCGTPVLSVDCGGMVETIEQGKTGLRCHTLADICLGIQKAIDGAFDRTYIRERACRLYDMKLVAAQYAYAFRCILDIHRPGINGWYSPVSHMEV